jgi:hypothetical protein
MTRFAAGVNLSIVCTFLQVVGPVRRVRCEGVLDGDSKPSILGSDSWWPLYFDTLSEIAHVACLDAVPIGVA